MNSKKQKFIALSGPLWNALGSLMYGGNTFLLLMLVSRCAGVEAAGDFGIAFTTAQMLYLIGIFGASNYQMTDYREDHSFRAYGILKAITGAAMVLAAAAMCLALGYDGTKTVLTLILTAYMLAHAVSELWQNRMFQKNRLDLSGKSLFFRTLVSLAAFAVCLLNGVDLTNSCLVLAGVNIGAIWLFSWLPCRHHTPASPVGGMAELPGLTRNCFPLFVSALLMTVLLQLPKYTVEAYCSPYLLGIFNMIFMPVQVINMVSGFIFRPMLKTMADRVEARDGKGLLNMLCRQFLLIGIFILICLGGSWLLGTPVLGALYGADLADFRWELLLIVLGGGIYAFCQVSYYVVLLFRRQKWIFCNYGICAVIHLAACPLLTRQFGIWGAIGSFIGIHIMLLLGYLWILAVQLRRLNHA